MARRAACGEIGFTHAATLLGIPGVTSADSRTVQVSGTLPDLYRQFGVWTRVATALTHQAPYC